MVKRPKTTANSERGFNNWTGVIAALRAALEPRVSPLSDAELHRAAACLEGAEPIDALPASLREIVELASSVNVVPEPASERLHKLASAALSQIEKPSNSDSRQRELATAGRNAPSADSSTFGSATQHAVQLAVRWVAQAAQVIAGSQWLVAATAVPVRSTSSEQLEPHTIRAQFPGQGGRLDVRLARSIDAQFNMEAQWVPSARDASHNSSSRVSVLRHGRELRSVSCKVGERESIGFANLDPGEYLVRITVAGRPVSEVPIQVSVEDSG